MVKRSQRRYYTEKIACFEMTAQAKGEYYHSRKMGGSITENRKVGINLNTRKVCQKRQYDSSELTKVTFQEPSRWGVKQSRTITISGNLIKGECGKTSCWKKS